MGVTAEVYGSRLRIGVLLGAIEMGGIVFSVGPESLKHYERIYKALAIALSSMIAIFCCKA